MEKIPCDESWIYCYDLETKMQSSQWKHVDYARPKKARQSKSTHKILMIPLFDSTYMTYMHWVPTRQTVNKEYYVEVLREFRKWFRRKGPALFKSYQWNFQQVNAPVHDSILVTDYLTKMGIKTVPHRPFSPDLAPCDFWLSPKLRGCRYETISEMKEAVRKAIDTLRQEYVHCWNCTTSALQLKKNTPKGTRVSCVYYQEKCPYEKSMETYLTISWLIVFLWIRKFCIFFAYN